jgi:formylglycine-generating enzyme required for sulfatase activity
MRAQFVIASIALAAQQAPAPCLGRPAAERPYTRLRLIDVIRDQSPVRAEYLIRTCGIRVPFNTELEADLKEAGAEEAIITAVKEVAPKPPAPKVVEPPKPAGPQAGDIRVNAKDGLRYAYVPPGSFRMGCASSGDEPCEDREKPAHDVRITKGFWMGQTEVTVEAYKRFAAGTGKALPEGPSFSGKNLNPGWRSESLPMTMVSWNDAVAFCSWAGLRLPTEAEWEYAARAGTTGARYAALHDVAWFGDNAGDSRIDAQEILSKDARNYFQRLSANNNRPRPVGQKQANAFKLYDTLGNVWEWTADWYKDKYEGGAPVGDPQGPAGGAYRVLRGGSWNKDASSVRASHRVRNSPAYRSNVYGFRCVGETLVP